MKYSFIDKKQLFLYILSAFFLTSCTFYNFSHPQPNDQENIYEFPDFFIGKWSQLDTTYTYDFKVEIPIDNNGGPKYNYNPNLIKNKKNEESDIYLIISKRNVLVGNGNVYTNESALIDGYWPKYNPEVGFIYPPNNMSSINVVKYDSLNRPVDTVCNYIFHNQSIYEKNHDNYLDNGYKYARINDTIIYQNNNSFYIDLGQNAFLRKLTDSIYVLNINSLIISPEHGSNWWDIYILEMKGNNIFNLWSSDNKTGELECMFYKTPSKDNQFYFDCRWSTKELLNLLKNKYFDYSIFKKKE